MTEFAFAVAPRTTQDIVEQAEAFLTQCGGENLRGAQPLQLDRLVDFELGQQGVSVYPVDADEIPASEAETRAGPDGWIDVLVRQSFYDSLFVRDRRTVRARSTIGHELGHVILHGAEVRAGRQAPTALALRRQARSKLRPFEDSEWQAHSFGGALLVPVSTLRRLPSRDPAWLAEAFDVSQPFVESHLRRVRRLL